MEKYEKKSTTLKHPLFVQMAEEHEQILSYMHDLDVCTNKFEIRNLIQNLWETAIEKHHYKEETLLFRNVYQKPRIVEGGPMCGLYYDFHMMEKIKESVELITQKPLSIESHQVDIINAKSPLIIPLEEHRGGKDLLAYIIENYDQLDIEAIRRHLNIFKKNLVSHILKEENCLYHMCANLLTDSEADEIYKLWKQG